MAETPEEINSKNEDAYLKAIIDKYQKDRYGLLHNYLSKPTNGSIRDKIITMLRKGENIDFENALKGFLGKYKITKREDLIDEADKNIEKYRAIQRLLLGDTVNGNNNADLLRLTAFLVGLDQEESTIITTGHSISITNINSGEDTNISIKKDKNKILINKVDSGKNTNLDVS